MSPSHTTEKHLPPELEAIATAAADRVRARLDEDAPARDEMRRKVADAASAAIATGTELAAIADAERAGQRRARADLAPDLLRRVSRAAGRKRQAETEYEQEILRAGRLGLSHREIASAATVAHATIRAILTRADGSEPQSGTAAPTMPAGETKPST
jgi:DNA-binding NarL/FixJ family response regulator